LSSSRDIESFSKSSRRFYNLSKKAVDKHKSQKIACREVGDKDPLTIPDVLENPELSWYFKRIDIYNRRSTYRDWQDDSKRVGDDDNLKCQGFYDYEKLERIQSIIDKSPYLAGADREKWIKGIRLGNDK
jgi:hypothetical protein